MFLDGAGEDRVDDAGFGDGDAVDRVDLQDAVHLDQGEDEAAVDGVGGAGESGAGALRDDGDAEGGGGPHDVLHLFGGAGQHDGGGFAGLAEARHVVGVGGGDVGVGEDGFGGQALAEPVQECGGAGGAGGSAAGGAGICGSGMGTGWHRRPLV